MKKSNMIITSCLAFLLVGLIGISLLTTNKGVKAEVVDTKRRFTLNTNTTFDFSGYATSTSENILLQDIDSNPYIFGIKTNDYLDDNLLFNYFAISIGKLNTNVYRLGIHTYNTINQSISTSPTYSLIYNYTYQMYILDLQGDFEDNPDIAQVNITALLNQGFNIVEGLPLPDNQISRGYNHIESGSITYYAFRSGLFITSYNEGDGFDAGFDEGATSEANKILGNPTLYGLYPESTVRQNYLNGYTAGLNASSNAFSRFGDILKTSWNSASTILNTSVFGPLTIIHLISIPILLGLFLIVLKLIRG